MKKFLSLLTLFSFFIPTVTLANSFPDESALQTSLQRIEAIGWNPIDKAIIRMVHNKTGQSHPLFPYENSSKIAPLSREKLGGFSVLHENDFGTRLDLYTGNQAIDESLQLSSIDRVREESSTTTLMDHTKDILETYKSTYGQYPTDFSELSFEVLEQTNEFLWYEYELRWENRPYYLDELQDLFNYSSDGNTYEISFIEPTVDLLKPVDIKSHPWEEMLEGRNFENIDMAELVPKDTLFLHFAHPEKYLELEKITNEVSDILQQDLYSFSDISKARPEILESLGIANQDFLIDTIDEMAFISEDFDYFTGTDYALVFKFTNSITHSGFQLIKDDTGYMREIGDYIVVASSDDLLEKINNAFQTEESLYFEKDFQYMLSVIESRRDGILYFSDAFIRKLTGPKYRILARKRNVVLKDLETLQYMSFAYKKITGKWAESLEEMEENGYASFHTIPDKNLYSIDQNTGKVSHALWGNIWETTPINRVELQEISLNDYQRYKNFASEYQSYFREFFDPVGIAITVSDQVMFHTIILPLIEESEYNFLKNTFSHDNNGLNILDGTQRLGAMNIIGNFDYESAVINTYRLENPETENDLSDDEILKNFESEFLEDFNIEKDVGDERVFDFLGDKVFFGLGEENNFGINNIANIDIWFGFELEDSEKGQKFLTKIYQKIFEETQQSNGFGFFQLAKEEPLKNSYNGKEYFVIPTGFVNLYYIFLDDSVYFSLSQLSINNIIDAKDENKDVEKHYPLLRNLDYIGQGMNFFVNMQFEKIANWESQSVKKELLSSYEREVYRSFQDRVDYLYEVDFVESLLENPDDISEYYSYIPEVFYQGKFSRKNNQVVFSRRDQSYEVNTIDTDIRFFEDDKNLDEEELVPLKDIIDIDPNPETIQSFLKKYASMSLGMKFTEHGLDVRTSFNNPYIDTFDERFETHGDYVFSGGKKNIIWVLAIIGGVLVLGIAGLLMVSKKK